MSSPNFQMFPLTTMMSMSTFQADILVDRFLGLVIGDVLFVGQN